MGNFEELVVWKRAKKLAVKIYSITSQSEFNKDYGLRDQIRRAGISIASNIAEGDELKTNKQSIHYFHVARGSAGEVYTQAVIAKEIGYLNEINFNIIQNETRIISKMLNKLIKVRSNNKYK